MTPNEVDSDNVDYEESANDQLSLAVKDGDLARVEHIVQEWRSKIAPTALEASHLQSSLAAAVSSGRLAIVSYLLDQGAAVSPNVIVTALNNNDPRAMFQIFLDHGWDINSKTGLGVTALKHVIRNEELTRWFLNNGADPNAFGKPGSTILDVAAANSTPAVFDLLLEHGAKLEDCDALHAAAGEMEKKPKRVAMMKFLLDDKGMGVNALGRREYPATRRRGRETPLHAAVTSQERDRIVVLIERGADVNARNSLGQTPMEYAISKNLTASIETLSSLLNSDTE